MSFQPSPHAAFIALVGTPNSGKSTLFNRLTGLHQKVGNFPGVTVEPKIGSVEHNGHSAQLIDLPGLYSLNAKSSDEAFSIEVLSGSRSNLPALQACVFVIDGTNLEKGLILYSQFAALHVPTFVVVTMIDAIKAQGAVLDDIGLQRELGVPVLTVVGSKGIGLNEVEESLFTRDAFGIPKEHKSWTSLDERVQWSRECASRVLNRHSYDPTTLKLDSILLHPILGSVVFLSMMTLFFVAIFSWAEPLMRLIEGGVSFLQDFVLSVTPAGLLQDFLNKGLLAGVGSVIVFLPQILLLMLFVTLLEDCGYLARAAFIVDRVMGIFGLQGRSFIPLLGSFACAIPGIMSARIIPSDKDRMATILVAPLMTCSARLPVYALLIAAFIPARVVLGFAPLQSLVLAGLYAVALISGLIVAYIFRKTLFRSEKLHFLIEFPPYRIPSIKSVSLTVWMRCQDFVKTAGTVILSISILLWILSEFPQSHIPQGTEASVAEQIQLEHSYIGQLGSFVQPVFAPLGFDWKVTVGVLGSFAARETFVSVMGQMYAADIQASQGSLSTSLRTAMSLPSALAVLSFYIFALQCMSTIAIIRRETGSWKWSVVAFSYTFFLAYTSSYLTFTIATWWIHS